MRCRSLAGANQGLASAVGTAFERGAIIIVSLRVAIVARRSAARSAAQCRTVSIRRGIRDLPLDRGHRLSEHDRRDAK